MKTTNDTSKLNNQKLTKSNLTFKWLDDMSQNKNAIRLHKKKKNYKNKQR